MAEFAKYCKNRGFSKEEYKTITERFNKKADEIIAAGRELHNWSVGVYYPVAELFQLYVIEEYNGFLIHLLKVRGVEFREDCTLYRM